MPPLPPGPSEPAAKEPQQAAPPARVVGVGASAGGVEAFTRLLRSLPSDTGMAFVLLSHLSPTHRSELARLLSPATWMPVAEATDGALIRPNHVYVLPPDRFMTMADGRLLLTDRGDAVDGRPTAVDRFLESLAAEQGRAAIGVILSGTGSDGTSGLEAIKSQGGMTYAEDPAVAAYSGMPRSAIDAGVVDRTLSIEGIARELATLDQPAPANMATDWGTDGNPDLPLPHLSASDAEAFESIIQLLQSATGVDFHHYKRPSLVRRIRRQAEHRHAPDLAAYLARLRREPAEVHALFQAVLIQVTRFFRESETFDALKAVVLPALATARVEGTPLRAWVIGCATGEEVYSLAMATLEVQSELGVDLPTRIFASDISESGLATARQGWYSEQIAKHVAVNRLERFFQPVDRGYQVNKQLREMCVFTRHDITRDPPFAQLDLVLCCNVLIYLDPVLQQRLLQSLHYAIKPGGYLVLGPAETTSALDGLFSQFDRKHKIYVRRAGPARIPVAPAGARPWPGAMPPDGAPRAPRLQWSPVEVKRAAEQVLFAEYPSASVIVNREFEVLHFQGRTSPWLEAPTGGPTAQLMRLAHPDLQMPLGRMLRRARKEEAPIRRAGLAIGTGRKVRRVNLSVLPIPLEDGEEQYFLIVFEAVAGKAAPAQEAPATGSSSSRTRELEAELAESREYLQTYIDQQDAAHAELQAAYEASLSITEEYQSTNEELESAKEELQSLNEELTTVNEQLLERNTLVAARSAEVSGLLQAVDMPLLLLTRDLRLRAYNDRAASEFGLTPSNVGRAIDVDALPIGQQELAQLVDRTIEANEGQERELRASQGRWQALRLWPIGPEGNPGAVALAFVDIAKLKADVAAATLALDYKDAVVETLLQPVGVIDADGKLVHANHAFHAAFGTSADAAAPMLEDLDGWQDKSAVSAFLTRVRDSSQPIGGPEVPMRAADGGMRIYRLNGGLVRWQGPPRLLLVLEDVTDRKLAEQAAQETSRMQAVGQLAGGIAHEVNNQMTVVIGLVSQLLKAAGGGETRHDDLQQIERAAERSAAVCQQLLAFSRRQALRPVVFSLNHIAAGSQSLLRQLLGPGVKVELTLGDQVGHVRADQAQLEQVLVNLAVNARDAMSGRGQLRVETRSVGVTPAGRCARLIVTDTGAGMDAATQARIFEPFFTTKPVGQGTGLGLASVYGMVKQSGGSIRVESEPGVGTTFIIDLPEVDAPAPVTPVEAHPVAPARGSETVLLVDDEPVLRSVVARMLRAEGYAVVEAESGEEGLELMSRSAPRIDIVVSDVIMPDMDGGELLARLRDGWPALPVVLTSGFGLDDLLRQGAVTPGAEPLGKPFTAAQLTARIRALLDTPH